MATPATSGRQDFLVGSDPVSEAQECAGVLYAPPPERPLRRRTSRSNVGSSPRTLVSPNPGDSASGPRACVLPDDVSWGVPMDRAPYATGDRLGLLLSDSPHAAVVSVVMRSGATDPRRGWRLLCRDTDSDRSNDVPVYCGADGTGDLLRPARPVGMGGLRGARP